MIRNCHDAYGIRTELYSVLVLGVGSFILFFVLSEVLGDDFGLWFEPGLVPYIGMWISHFIAVIWPLVKLYSGRTNEFEKEQERDDFMTIINTPDLFEEV